MDTLEQPLLLKIKQAFLQQGGEAHFFDTLQNDASFALPEVLPYLGKGRALEIGSGAGLLAMQLRQRGHSIHSLEPYADGFTRAEQIQRITSQFSDSTHHQPCGIEQYRESTGFSLIYSVNVFEHLRDWRAAIRKAVSLLDENGKLLLLCPNYSFPYEPHFHLQFWEVRS